MSSGVTMRSSKARTLLYVLAGCALMFLVFVLSSTHSKLKDAEESNDKCQQQRDSLSAQLQVLYEHKSRLEKSLQTEMADRKKTETELKSLREDISKEKMDINMRYQELQKRFDDVQKSHLEEFGNLKGSYASIQGEKEKLEADLGKQLMVVQQEKETERRLQDQILQLQAAFQQEKEKLGLVQSQLSMCQAKGMELVQEVNRYSAAVQANAKAPIVLQSAMSPQKDVHPADRGAQAQDAARPANKSIAPEKHPNEGHEPVLRMPLRSHPVRPHSQLAPPQYQLASPVKPQTNDGQSFVLDAPGRERDPIVHALLAGLRPEPREEYQLAAPNFKGDGGSHGFHAGNHDSWHRQ